MEMMNKTTASAKVQLKSYNNKQHQKLTMNTTSRLQSQQKRQVNLILSSRRKSKRSLRNTAFRR
jgi:hypothetical protein